MSEPQATPSELDAKLGDVRASVRPNLEISRHVFNGKPTYVVRDPVTAQTHRFSAQDYQLFISVDQTRTLRESVEQLIQKNRIGVEQTDDFYRFVVHLHQMGLPSLHENGTMDMACVRHRMRICTTHTLERVCQPTRNHAHVEQRSNIMDVVGRSQDIS